MTDMSDDETPQDDTDPQPDLTALVTGTPDITTDLDWWETLFTDRPFAETRIVDFSDGADYAMASDIAWAAAQIIQGSSMYPDHTLTVCPECGHETNVSKVVFPNANRTAGGDDDE